MILNKFNYNFLSTSLFDLCFVEILLKPCLLNLGNALNAQTSQPDWIQGQLYYSFVNAPSICVREILFCEAKPSATLTFRDCSHEMMIKHQKIAK